MMRVSVVSEHLLPAELVATALRAEGTLEVMGVIGGATALESAAGVRALKATVILFAALVPPETGLLRRVTAGEGSSGAARRSVVVADLCGCVGVGPAIQLGARGYVAPWERTDVLAPRVLLAGQGGLAVPPGSADGLRLAMRVFAREATAMRRLSETDFEVLRGLSRGDSTSEIGARLNVTEAAIRSRLRRIMTQLGVRNETELSAMAASAGLYEPRTPAA
jgi:two-component system, NarL family, nitrate/nitrite response regulator NarL